MPEARFQHSRQGGVRFPTSPFSLLLWTSLLFSTAASGSGQTALAQQKTMAAASGAAPAATGAFNGAGIGTGTRVIDGLWQFHVGDDPRWAQPGFDDSGWQRLPIDRSSAEAEDPGYTGFRWYRRQLSLDPSDKSPLSLYIRAVYVVEVYWNGAKVGGMGTPPPHTAWYWNQPPVAIPLPSSPGARSATLAFRVWTPDDWPGSPFVEIPQLGYAPLIHEMRERYVEHRLRRLLASVYTVDLIEFCVGLAALILWLRSRFPMDSIMRRNLLRTPNNRECFSVRVYFFHRHRTGVFLRYMRLDRPYSIPVSHSSACRLAQPAGSSWLSILGGSLHRRLRYRATDGTLTMLESLAAGTAALRALPVSRCIA
jgi:hypothetical protein